MSHRERITIYSILGLVVILNLSLLFAPQGKAAIAAASEWFQDLGPADRLILNGENRLHVRNVEGRLSWSDNEHGRAYGLGFIQLSKVLNALMERPALAEEREALQNDLQARADAYESQLEEISGQLNNLPENSPEFARILEQGQAIYNEYLQWNQEAATLRDRLVSEQYARSYNELVAAVDVVADRRGVDLVLRFSPNRAEFDDDNTDQALVEIQQRIAIKYPDGLDLTDDVITELALVIEG